MGVRQSGKKWIAEVRKRRADGNFYKSKTFNSKKQANDWLRRIETELELETNGQINTVKTFGDAVERYIKEVSPGKPSERWEIIKAERLKYSPIYNVMMNRIDSMHVAEYRDQRREKVTDGTVLRELGFISAVFNRAMKEWRWINSNPVELVSKPKQPPPRDRRISKAEINEILKHLKFNEQEPIKLKMQQVGALFLLALETAMRMTEMTTLTWEQVDFEHRYIQLIKTKNGDKRQVPLSTRAIEILLLLKHIDKSAVFTVSSSVADTSFRKAKNKTNIKNLHFHDTRREAISRLAKKLDVMNLAKMTGHRDLKILLNVYYSPSIKDVTDLLG